MAKFGKKNKVKLNITDYNVGIIGESGIGKEQPLTSLIATPTGFKPMGEMVIGQEIFGEDGNVHKVVGVYPQGIKEVYEITFSDGTTTKSGLEHLWHVQTKKQRENSRKNNDYRYKVLTLKEIMEDYNSPKVGYKYSVPLTSPVKYEEKELPINPKLLGMLLGDGGFTSSVVTFTNAESEILECVIEEIEKMNLTYVIKDFENHKQLIISNKNKNESLLGKLAELGLKDKGSREKFIPKEYLTSSIEQRLELLSGLLNTDGSVSKGVSLQLCTYSNQLAKDVQELALSLGYGASLNSYDRTSELSTSKYDKEVEYHVNIMGDFTLLINKLSKKHLTKLTKRDNTYVKSIVNIQLVSKEETQCIKVSNPTSLYLTDNYIVTHNTTIMKEALEKLVGEDGYLIANIGAEDGVDALPNVSYEDFPDLETFLDFVEDVIDNKQEDYPDLKVVVIDTSDELFRIAEPYIVYLHNKEFPQKKVQSIKAAFGGFQAGEDKAIDIIFDAVGRLKREAGVSTWWTGHTKRKSQTDVVTGEEYETLTSNMMAKYFNSIKTKLHVLGVASIDRDIEKVKKKQKIGEDKVIGKVKSENRIITFRDDNFNIDSKSRFSEIADRIALDADEFIKALEDAITKTFEKQGGKVSDIKKEAKKQEVDKKKEVEAKKEEKESNEDVINESFNKKAFEKIKEFSLNDDSDEDVKIEISKLFTTTGKKASNVDSIPSSIYKKALSLIEEATE